jgi:hypothetical protein
MTALDDYTRLLPGVTLGVGPLLSGYRTPCTCMLSGLASNLLHAPVRVGVGDGVPTISGGNSRVREILPVIAPLIATATFDGRALRSNGFPFLAYPAQLVHISIVKRYEYGELSGQALQ